MAKLTIIQGPDSGRQFLLKKGCQVIGRIADAAVQLPSKAVSRRHAQILGQDDGYVLEDLGGVNGTLVNGQRLAGSLPLSDGDELAICEYLLAFSEEPAPEVDANRFRKRSVMPSSNAAFVAPKSRSRICKPSWCWPGNWDKPHEPGTAARRSSSRTSCNCFRSRPTTASWSCAKGIVSVVPLPAGTPDALAALRLLLQPHHHPQVAPDRQR